MRGTSSNERTLSRLCPFRPHPKRFRCSAPQVLFAGMCGGGTPWRVISPLTLSRKPPALGWMVGVMLELGGETLAVAPIIRPTTQSELSCQPDSGWLTQGWPHFSSLPFLLLSSLILSRLSYPRPSPPIPPMHPLFTLYPSFVMHQHLSLDHRLQTAAEKHTTQQQSSY